MENVTENKIYLDDEPTPEQAAKDYLSMLESGKDDADERTGTNPLLKDEPKAEKPHDEMDEFLESFDMYTPLTDYERETIDRGVNDEVFDSLREKAKDAEVAGDVEKMDRIQKMIQVFDRCRQKGLRAGYIKLVDGNIELNDGYVAPKDPNDDIPTPPPPKEETEEPPDGESQEEPSGDDAGDGEGPASADTSADGGQDQPQQQPPPQNEEITNNPPAQDELNHETLQSLGMYLNR